MTYDIYSYYDKPVPKASLAAQIAENPEVEVTAKKELTVLISELEHLSKVFISYIYIYIYIYIL